MKSKFTVLQLLSAFWPMFLLIFIQSFCFGGAVRCFKTDHLWGSVFWEAIFIVSLFCFDATVQHAGRRLSAFIAKKAAHQLDSRNQKEA